MTAARFPYRDGVGVVRCNACLRTLEACACERIPTMRLFDDDHIGVYLDAIGHRIDKTADGKECPAVDLTLRVQPFTPALAQSVDDDVRALLFTMSEGIPKSKLKAIHFNLAFPRQSLAVYLTPDTDAGALLIPDVEITAPRARTEKGVDGFGFVFYASFGPVGRDELAYLVAWHTQQRFVTFNAQQPTLNFKGADESTAPPPRAPRRSAVGAPVQH